MTHQITLTSFYDSRVTTSTERNKFPLIQHYFTLLEENTHDKAISGTWIVLTMNSTGNNYLFEVIDKKTTQQTFNCSKFKYTQSYQ